MIRNTHSIRFVLPISLVFMLFFDNVAQAAEFAAATPRVIEVFTSTDLPIASGAVINTAPGRPTSELQIYNLDGIQRIEAKFSKDLSADPEQSKRIVLQRIQQLSATDRAQMQRTAMGLAKAVQYGIDRYPAIVFDSEVVIYGVTDIREAFRQYQQWREGGK